MYIKRVPTDSAELQIALRLSSESLRRDPNNHCVPIIDHFEDEADRTMTFMVMPFLLPIDEPPFETVEDVVDFADQMLTVRFRGSLKMTHSHRFYAGLSIPTRAGRCT